MAAGVEHFFLYNNTSTDDSLDCLQPYVDGGLATVVEWTHDFQNGGQRMGYRDCLDKFGHLSRWIAFIDIDEFLFCPTGRLDQALSAYEPFGGVVVNWQCYGSSGRRNRAPGLVTDSFLYRAKSDFSRNYLVKSIVDPSRVVQPLGSHFFQYIDGAYAVDENKDPAWSVPSSKIFRAMARWSPWFPFDPYSKIHSSRGVSVNKLRINHYVVKSHEEYFEKRGRWGAQTRYDERFFRYHDRNDVFDPILRGRVAGTACSRSSCHATQPVKITSA